jgi:hypothetical protein
LPAGEGVEQRAHYTHYHGKRVEHRPTIAHKRPEPVHEKIEHELENIKDCEAVINNIKRVFQLLIHVGNFRLRNIYPKIDHQQQSDETLRISTLAQITVLLRHEIQIEQQTPSKVFTWKF